MRVYTFIALVAGAATALLAHDLVALGGWPTQDQLSNLGVLLLLLAGAARFEFQLRTGWRTNATTVPHIAAALLLPPGLAAIVGLLTRAMYPRPFELRKFIFNTANTTLSVAVATHLAQRVVGDAELTSWQG